MFELHHKARQAHSFLHPEIINDLRFEKKKKKNKIK